MTVDLWMPYMLILVTMTLTLMQDHWVGQKNQLWIISTTKHATSIKLATSNDSPFFKWRWLWTFLCGLIILLGQIRKYSHRTTSLSILFIVLGVYSDRWHTKIYKGKDLKWLLTLYAIKATSSSDIEQKHSWILYVHVIWVWVSNTGWVFCLGLPVYQW